MTASVKEIMLLIYKERTITMHAMAAFALPEIYTCNAGVFSHGNISKFVLEVIMSIHLCTA